MRTVETMQVRSVVERVVLFGDLGGWCGDLEDRLGALGWDPVSGALPAGTTVVFLGDLVHRGPDSSGVLRVVGSLMAANPGRVRVVVGNHEGIYLDGPGFVVPDPLGADEAALLRDWWRVGSLSAAVAVSGSDGTDWLCTHAGLTRPTWEDIGSPGSAAVAASGLQRLWDDEPGRFWRAGRMLEVGVDLSAGPAWAEAGSELYASWSDASCPFSQVHGHSSAYDWYRSSWRSPAWAQRGSVEHGLRHVRLSLGAASFVGIDPGLGRSGVRRWEPLVIAGHLV